MCPLLNNDYTVPFWRDEDDSAALWILCIFMAPLEFDAEFARLFPAHLSSHTLVNSTADHLAFLQGQLKHTPPPSRHTLEGKFEAAKDTDNCLTTRYDVNKRPLFPHAKKVFNQAFVLATCFITLVWHQINTWNEEDEVFLWTFCLPELSPWSRYDHQIVVHGILLCCLSVLLETAYVHEKKNHDLKISKMNVFKNNYFKVYVFIFLSVPSLIWKHT